MKFHPLSLKPKKIGLLKPLLLLLAMINATPSTAAETSTNAAPAETAAQRAQRMAWFNNARFGMFIHWGVYSVPAGEWQGQRTNGLGEWIMNDRKIPVSEYEKFAAQFDPEKFNATEWVRMAKEAGVKYIVITSKHHDGFAMWRSDLSDWGIKATPFHRDPLKELADACHAAGLKMCFYYSIMDWHHPDWPERRAWNDKATGAPDMDRYVAYMKGQLKELITRYGPVGILWFDGEWEKPWTTERALDLYKYLKGLQPSIIINNRIGKGREGMNGMDKGQGVGDYGTPEQQIPANGFGPGVNWESCMTMNDTWGFRKDDQHWKSTQTLVRNLIDCASKGGNYLLNIGPTSEGLFPEASITRLHEIGGWMKTNGVAIYGTTASPFPRELSWGRCTKKGNTLYLHVFNWPADGKLHVPVFNKKAKARLLAEPHRKLPCSFDADGLVIQLPNSAPDSVATVIALQNSLP
ncbi:MAG TPA: alpha-L-fucosidase [Verrucomicrobiae bacterium]|jgi:alpha-L-fucosidase|nr:alpha-L-fucosidase [Verrucomicrobiae bacterium]